MATSKKKKCFILASPNSGSGKTTITIILANLIKKALKATDISIIKLGPDYLDTALHTDTLQKLFKGNQDKYATNLDPWCMRDFCKKKIISDALNQQKDNEYLIIESVTGLFDGARDLSATTADFANQFNIPVLLVLDCKGQGATIAATVAGLLSLKPKVNIAGIILNRVSSESHLSLIKASLKKYIKDCPKIVGAVYSNKELDWPSRYLGLFTNQEDDQKQSLQEKVASQIGLLAQQIDIEFISKIPFEPSADNLVAKKDDTFLLPAPGKNIAIARDKAFYFSYMAQIQSWQKSGVRISYFSPLADEEVAKNIDCIIVPGGYPELFAKKVSQSSRTMGSIREAAASGKKIYGECGGASYLGSYLIDKEGNKHNMCNLIPIETNYSKPKRTMGYRKVQLLAKDFFANLDNNLHFRGHEFHYGIVTKIAGDENAVMPSPMWRWQSADSSLEGLEGFVVKNIAASFIHLIDIENL